MNALPLAPLTQWITEAALQHGDHLAEQVMARLQLPRRSATRLLRRLEAAQWLVAEGSPRRPRYKPGALRQVVKRYPLAGLQEDLPWRRDFAPCFELKPELAWMVQHCFTELLNNAIDHSGGSAVAVSLRTTPVQVQLLISDDGVGLFSRIAQDFAISDPALAMLEISKGKLTSDPVRHCGQGLVFCSRTADVFEVQANDSAFQQRGWDHRGWQPGRSMARRGTSVYAAFARDSLCTIDAVLRDHSEDGQSLRFERAKVPLNLIAAESGGFHSLASRADAKRVVSRLTEFAAAELDFTGIDAIGHAFADELFRVFPNQHPDVALATTGLTPRVAAMIDAVR